MFFTIQERAKYVIRWLMKEEKRTQKDIATQLGYQNHTSFSQILNGKSEYPKNLPARIAALDPRINIDFLLGTSDEMLIGEGQETPAEKPETPKPTNPATTPRKAPEKPGIYVPPELVQMFEDLTSTVRSQQSMIQTLIETAKDKASIAINNVNNNK